MSLPKPGMVKTCSVRTAPPRSWPDERVAQRVAVDHPRLPQALGPGRAHEVRAQDHQHGAPCLAHELGGDGRAEHDRGHDRRRQVLPEILARAHIARRRQPAELDREEEDHHDAEPEVRHRQPGEPDDISPVVEQRALLHRRDDAGRDADEDGDGHRHRRQLQGDRQLRLDQLADGELQADGLAEIALQYPGDPVAVLHVDRLVQVIELAHIGDHLRIAVLARQRQGRVARQQQLQAEHHHRDDDQRRHADEDAPQDVGEHRVSPPGCGCWEAACPHPDTPPP